MKRHNNQRPFSRDQATGRERVRRSIMFSVAAESPRLGPTTCG
jgi:hypothetical protein